jgi:predicted ATP-grasp superfamily ATP-dependent carboligase
MIGSTCLNNCCVGDVLNHEDTLPGAVIIGANAATLAAARNLFEHGVSVCIIGSAISAVQFSWKLSRFAKWPPELKNENLPAYLLAMAETCHLKGSVLFPSSDEHVRILAQHASLLTKHFVLATPPWQTVKHFYDKRLTYALAQDAGVAIPHTFLPENAYRLSNLGFEFPVILKPAIIGPFLGATQKKAYRADNLQELQRCFEAMSRVIAPAEVIVQELLPEPSKNLFSFAGYFREGEAIAGLAVKRVRQYPKDFGRSSTLVEMVELPELENLAHRILKAISYTGLAEVEFMWNAKRARFELIEVNARLWAWQSLMIAAGLDLPWLAFSEAIGRKTAIGGQRRRAKWACLSNDMRAVAPELLSGAMGIRQYLQTLHGINAIEDFSLSDPMPFLVKPFLLPIVAMQRWPKKSARLYQQLLSRIKK